MTDAAPRADGAASDHVVRAITDDDNFRVITASTTHTVRQALEAQQAAGNTARHFADLITGTVLIRETMSPTHRVQGLLKGAGGRGNLVADTHPDGLTRGLVQLPKDLDEFRLGPGSVLQMMRSMARGGIHRSVVQPSPEGTVPEALMTYMQESEQIVAMIATGLAWEGERVAHAGGFVVQLLPGAARGPLMIMTERLEAMPRIDELLGQLGGSPHRLLEELLYQMPFAQLDIRPVTFGCKCSPEAVVASLASIGRGELADIVRDNEVLELSCDYCHSEYRISRAHLRGLLESS
jgi:molecular chaperone Hsp33